MKKTFAFLTFVCMLSTLSCTPPNREHTRGDVLGLWKATKTSLKKQNQNKILSFQLNEDSTATISRNDITQEEKKGTWLWNIEKKIGKNNFGINFYSDVRLNVDYDLIVLFLLEDRSDGLYLIAGDYEFKKVN